MRQKPKDILIRWWNSDKHQISFLGIPKTGSSTVRASLGIDVENDWTLAPKYEETFTVLRDPYLRIKSSYQECKRRRTLRKGKEDFHSFLLSLKDGFFDNHCYPQVWYYQEVKHVFTTENIDYLFNWLNVPVKNANVSKPYQINLTKDQSRLIGDLYFDDIILYRHYVSTFNKT